MCQELSRVLIPTPLSVHFVATKLSSHLLLLVFIVVVVIVAFFVLFLSTCYFQGFVLCGDRRERYIFLVLQV